MMIVGVDIETAIIAAMIGAGIAGAADHDLHAGGQRQFGPPGGKRRTGSVSLLRTRFTSK